jgi:large subunit ribosomal protein L24
VKFKVGDKVLVTAGKDKGKTSVITAVSPKHQTVTVKDANMYTRHNKPVQGKSGEKVRKERSLATAKVAIINDKGNRDRIGYHVAKDGSKERVFKKTGQAVPDNAPKVESKK